MYTLSLSLSLLYLRRLVVVSLSLSCTLSLSLVPAALSCWSVIELRHHCEKAPHGHHTTSRYKPCKNKKNIKKKKCRLVVYSRYKPCKKKKHEIACKSPL
jgi:hypothetical protein